MNRKLTLVSIAAIFVLSACTQQPRTNRPSPSSSALAQTNNKQIKLDSFTITPSPTPPPSTPLVTTTPPQSTVPPQSTPPPSTKPSCGSYGLWNPSCMCEYSKQEPVLLCAKPDALGCGVGAWNLATTRGECMYRGNRTQDPNFFGDGYGIPDDANPGYYLYFSRKITDPGCNLQCIGKPVIYLYPKVPTIVDVLLTIPGRIYISDPVYPKEGWLNVLAFPSGQLLYNGKSYNELYYESEIADVAAPSNGIVLPTPLLRPLLAAYTTQLGLIEREREEFLDYWLPQLEATKKPYILFSILDQKEKERIDTVAITPKPDTFIAFIAHFTPLDKPIDIEPLKLPSTIPSRVGFTAVEWGGTIAKE